MLPAEAANAPTTAPIFADLLRVSSFITFSLSSSYTIYGSKSEPDLQIPISFNNARTLLMCVVADLS